MALTEMDDDLMQMTTRGPRYHVLSMRVSDEELSMIKCLLLREKVTISELMREAVQVVCHRMEAP